MALLTETPEDQKAGKTLSAVHTLKEYNNLSNWLLQQIGLDNKEILFSVKTGELKSLGFRALAHLCVIIYPNITQEISPISAAIGPKIRGNTAFSAPAYRPGRFCVTPEAAP